MAPASHSALPPIDPFSVTYVEVSSSYAVRQQWRPGHTERTRFVEADTVYALWLVLRGTVRVAVGGEREWAVRAGQAFLCPLAREREVTTPEGAEWLSMSLQATLFGQIDLLRDTHPPVLWTPAGADRERLGAWMTHYIAVVGSARPADRLIRHGLVTAIAGLCCAMLEIPVTAAIHQDIPEWLASVLRVIQEHPGTSMSALAGLAQFSEAHFRRRFAHYTGMSPHAYAQHYQMRLARELLTATDLPIGEVAHAVGIGSPAHFSRHFARAVGVPPLHYRKLARLAHA
jgi:AraC-like DNA-binding protein